MPPRKTPMRTCTGCASTSDKRAFVRFVRSPDGDVAVDPTGKANGRGAYTCARTDCFETAVRKGRLASTLRVRLSEEDVDQLRSQFECQLADRGLRSEKAGEACA